MYVNRKERYGYPKGRGCEVALGVRLLNGVIPSGTYFVRY